MYVQRKHELNRSELEKVLSVRREKFECEFKSKTSREASAS